MKTNSSNFYNLAPFTKKLFGDDVELLPTVTELFELELAYLEYYTLDKNEILKRTAYIKKINGKESLHYRMYSKVSDKIEKTRTQTANSYFNNRLFSTGYATHSLFPYRGKFHPQLIKALINILGVKKGEVILDPMAGSGTTNIEAALLGIDSIAIDVSPFCQFMVKVKYNSLTISLNTLEKTEFDSDKLFDFFSSENIFNKLKKIDGEKRKIYDLALLAYLDALGYSKRVVRSDHKTLFKKVLLRYVETVKNILRNEFFDSKQLGKIEILSEVDAMKTNLDNDSIDAIITSPPYSFAIDYIENDKDQLDYFGYDTEKLKGKMIGLKGKSKKEKLEIYFEDMDKFFQESARILKKNKFLVLIIGSNTNQTGGIRLEEKMIISAKNHKLELVKSILKPIKGMRNTMKEEFILFFKRI